VTARLARWVLGCAVQHWPEENRAWGLAPAAEIGETASAFETVRWEESCCSRVPCCRVPGRG